MKGAGGLTAAAGGAFKYAAGRGLRKGAKRARLLEQQNINQAIGYLKPYMDAGNRFVPFAEQGLTGESAPELGDDLAYVGEFEAPTAGSIYEDPSYQFRLDQGQRTLENSAAANGGLLGSNTARDLIDYGQGSASQEYGNIFNRALQSYQARLSRLGANVGRYGADLSRYQTDVNKYGNMLNFGAGVNQAAGSYLTGSRGPEYFWKGYAGQAQMRSDMGDSLMGMGSAQMGATGAGTGGISY